MIDRIRCTTWFDITCTGVRGAYNVNRLPLKTSDGKILTDQASWERARNQQRNWETINQIISLRCLPENITESRRSIVREHTCWQFEFDITDASSVGTDDEPLGLLRADAQGVPFILGLDETKTLSAVVNCVGADPDIWFEFDS